MGFRFKLEMDCVKCKTKMIHYSPSEGGYYKCEKCNNILIT